MKETIKNEIVRYIVRPWKYMSDAGMYHNHGACGVHIARRTKAS